MTRQARAYVCGGAAVLLWSTVASAFKLTLRHVDYAQMLLYASIVSLVVLTAVLAVRGRLGDIGRASAADWRRSLLLGLLNPFVYYLILFRAYELLPAQVAQPLNYTWALTLALLSIPLLKQKLAATDVLAGFVCYGGVLVISRVWSAGGRQLSPLGIALALASTVVWALYWLWNTRDERDPAVALFMNFAVGLPFVLAWCLIFSTPFVRGPAGLLGSVYVGAVEMGFAFILWLAALKLSTNTSRVANLIFLSPFLSLVFINAFVGERIMASTVVGLVLIVAGLTVQQWGARRARGRESDLAAVAEEVEP